MKNSISYAQLSILLGSFLLGVVTILFINNFLLEDPIQFSTLSLIGFVFSIIFGAASIVLAITAINLGKKSEELMIQRSDKSIELQNEVYIKTTEALNKIESSTGVTEKRIEDIISGRAGDIASKLVDENLIRSTSKESIENEIRNAIQNELSGSSRAISQEDRMMRFRASQEYEEYKDKILLKLANSENTQTLKIGNGKFSGSKFDLVDGAYLYNDTKLGICTFYGSPILKDKLSFDEEFINRIAKEISDQTFDIVYFVFDTQSVILENFKIMHETLKNRFVPEIISKMKIVIGNPEEVANQILNK
jgi:hypothetical protein